MALFSSNLRKMMNEVSNAAVDWGKLVALSAGKYDFSGKNAADGKIFAELLIKKIGSSSLDSGKMVQLFRNIAAHGIDLNKPLNQAGETPLHFAAGLSDSTLLNALLESGLQPLSSTRTGATPLHVAVSAGLPENVRLLLAKGADPGAEDADGNAPLHSAVRLEEPLEIIKMLLDAGAKPYHRNSDNDTAISISIKNGNEPATEVLKESLKNLRRSTDKSWKCPECGYPIKRPKKKKVEWYLSLDMWEYLSFTCGRCGHVASAMELDGEV